MITISANQMLGILYRGMVGVVRVCNCLLIVQFRTVVVVVLFFSEHKCKYYIVMSMFDT